MYIPSTKKIISSYNFLYESFSSALGYTPHPYLEAMAMRLAVTYTPYATYSTEPTCDMIKFAKFEQGDLLFETCDNTESGDESDNYSIIPPLIIEEEEDTMYLGYEYED